MSSAGPILLPASADSLFRRAKRAGPAPARRFAQERIRQRQERSISGVREGLAEGGEALGMGFYRGMTGLVSKPLEGAQARGLSGFVKVRALSS